MRGKKIFKKITAAVMSAVMLFSGVAILDRSGSQPNAIVAEAANDTGILLEAPKGKRVYLKKNTPYYSPLKNYVCIFQNDGNLVVYRYRSWKGLQKDSENVVWASRTYNNPNATACLQADGNFVIYNTDKYGYTYALFHTHTYVGGNEGRQGSARLRLSRYGNLYVQHEEKDGWKTKWSSDTASDGKRYRAPEPDCVNLVGKWKADWGTHWHDNGRIKIDFPDENNQMKVTMTAVAGVAGANSMKTTSGYINVDDIQWDKYEKEKKCTFKIRNTLDYETIVIIDMTNEGLQLKFGNPKLKNEGHTYIRE